MAEEYIDPKDLAELFGKTDASDFDWKGALDKVTKFFSSPQGIAGLGGAALGYLDRPKPSGGGTTMAYPGAAQLERKMVQGPYGPLAEYTGVGSGAPDYTRFTAPKVEFPTVSPAPAPGSGMSVQSKVDLYKQLRGYGLPDERIRRIAETMFGPQTDSDWSELTRRAGPASSGIAAPVASPVASPRTSAPIASPAAGGGGGGGATGGGATGGGSLTMRSGLTTEAQKIVEYNRLRAAGMTDAQVRESADRIYGKQTDADWSYLTGKSQFATGATGTAAQNPFVTAVRNATKDSNYTDVSFTPVSTIFDKNPIIQQTIDRIKQIDPSVVINDYDIRQFAGAIEEVGAETAVRNFIGEKRRMVGFYDKDSTAPHWERHTMADPTYKAYTELSHSFRTKATQEDWDRNTRRLTHSKNQPLAIWRDPTSGTGVAVNADSRGQPGTFTYLSEDGTALNSTSFNAADLYKYADELGMDLSNIGQLGAKLDATGVGYKPYELYKGTGSDHGIDFQDIAQGGMGTAYDWTQDPLAHLKGPTGVKSLANNQALAQRLEVTKNPAVTTEQGIDPTKFTTLMAGGNPRSNVAFTGGTASWYDTPEQAQDYLNRVGGGQSYSTATGTPTLAAAPAAPVVAQPRDLTSLLPSDWASYTGAEGAKKKIDWFNQQKATESELKRAGVTSDEMSWMRRNKLGTFAGGGITQGYAHGGMVHMEDGGFVLTKRAVDGAGGPRGIQQLVPGARMIRGPGHGTSDSIPAVINGRNGQTPARLSNGEAYVPRRFVQDQGGPQRMYTLMNNLQRKA